MHTQFFKFPFVGFLLIEIINFRYDAEATYFDEGVRSAKRKQLEEKLLQVIHLHPILQLNDYPTFSLFLRERRIKRKKKTLEVLSPLLLWR